MKIHGLILSAGFSSRIEGFKPLLNYNGKSFIVSILKKLIVVCNEVGIVTGFKYIEVENEIKKLNFEINKIQLIYNPDFEKGMFSSLQAGLKKMSDCDWLLYHFVDQPHIPEQFYTEFINQIDNKYQWIQPQYKNIKGHPILIHQSIFSKILNSEISSLKDISHSPEVKKKIWDCNYPQIIEDIDTKEDYQKLT